MFSRSKSRRVIIACSGSFGRELAGWLKAYEPSTEFLGFIDDYHPHDCLGSISGHQPRDGVTYLVANGRGSHRVAIAELLESRGAYMGSLISPKATLGTPLTEENQVLILGNASISVDVAIGHQTMIQELSVVGHDVTLGRGCTLSSFSFVGGGAQLGDRVTVFPHVTILPRVRVGDNATLGAGSVVIKDVTAGHTVFGNPAKSI